MAKAKLAKEIYLETPNEIGMLAKISTVIANSGVNIVALYAYGERNKAKFRIVTSDNAKAMEALKPLNFKMNEEEVVLLELEDKTGVMAEVSRKLAIKKVNLKYIYGTTIEGAPNCILVLSAEDNEKVMKVLI